MPLETPDTIKSEAAAISPEFTTWVAENPAIVARFFLEAHRVWLRGRRHYSARTIIEFIRHETSLADASDLAYKINNNVVPKLARLYLRIYPERDGLFELRNKEETPP